MATCLLLLTFDPRNTSVSPIFVTMQGWKHLYAFLLLLLPLPFSNLLCCSSSPPLRSLSPLLLISTWFSNMVFSKLDALSFVSSVHSSCLFLPYLTLMRSCVPNTFLIYEFGVLLLFFFFFLCIFIVVVTQHRFG